MQKRCSISTKPRKRSGSPRRTFLFRPEPPIDLPIMYDCWCVNISNSLWTSCWMCLTWLIAHLISFVRSRHRRHRSLFVYLTFRLCWCILRAQSIALKGGFSPTPHRLFIFTVMNVKSTCLSVDNRDAQKSPIASAFPDFTNFFAVVLAKKHARKSLPRAREVMTQKKLINRYQTHCRTRIASRGLTLCFRDNFLFSWSRLGAVT